MAARIQPHDDGGQPGRRSRVLATRGRKAAAAVAVAALAAIGGGIGTWAFGSAKDRTERLLGGEEAPIDVQVLESGTYAPSDALGPFYVFPPGTVAGPAALTRAELESAYHQDWRWAPPRGGVAGSPQLVRLRIRAPGDEEVSITRISARVVGRLPAVRGWFVAAPPGCTEESVRVADIDLDAPGRSAAVYRTFGSESKSLSLAVTKADAEQVELRVRLARGSAEWEAQVYYAGARSGVVRVNDRGRPFRLTSTAGSRAYSLSGSNGGFTVRREPGWEGRPLTAC